MAKKPQQDKRKQQLIDELLKDYDGPESFWGDWGDYCDEEPQPILNGWAEVDVRNPKYTIFKIEVELRPGLTITLQMYRSSRFPNTPYCQRNHWWYWHCPDCDRRCRYLYTLPRSAAAMCRKCWNFPYRSQNKSHAHRQKDYWEKNKHLYRGYHTDGHEGWYESDGGVPRCISPTVPQASWVPADLLKRFRTEQARRDGTEMPTETEADL